MKYSFKDKMTVFVLVLLLLLTSFFKFYSPKVIPDRNLVKILNTLPIKVIVVEQIQTLQGNATVAEGMFTSTNCQEYTKFINYIAPNKDFTELYSFTDKVFSGEIVSVDGKPKAKSIPLLALGLTPAFSSAKHSGFCAALKALPYILQSNKSGLYTYKSQAVDRLSEGLNYSIESLTMGNSYQDVRLSLNEDAGILKSISVFHAEKNGELTMVQKITFIQQ